MADNITSCASLGCASVTLGQFEYCSFSADPDIAGIGVILSFVISVILTFLLAIYGFYFVKNSFIEDSINQLDKVIIQTAERILKHFTSHDNRVLTQQVFRKTILQFSDTQMVTGLAILLVGFFKTRTITSYHFSVVGDLGNMAFVVQLSTIDIVAKEFEGRPQGWWRVVGIISVALLATASTIPWFNRYFLNTTYGAFGAPVKCIWSSIPRYLGPYQATQATLYMILQVWAIVSILWRIFPWLSTKQPFKFIDRVARIVFSIPFRVHHHADQRCQHLQATNSLSLVLWTLVRATSYLAALATFFGTEIVLSQAFSLMRNWSFLLLNVIEVFDYRAEANAYYQFKIGNEDAWGFGQLVPLLLLILPISMLFEVYFDGYFQRQAQEAEHRLQLEEQVQGQTMDTTLSTDFAGDNTPTVHAQSANSSLDALLCLDSNMRRGGTSQSRTHHSGNIPTAKPQAQQIPGSDYLDFSHFYEKDYFKFIMMTVMFSLFVGTTVAAVYGWSF